MLASPAHAYVQLSQSQTKEMTLGLMEEVKAKLAEDKKDVATTMCVAAREIVLRKFPRVPDDLLESIKGTCQPLFEAMGAPPDSAKTALEKYSEQISEMSFLMTVGPLGGAYDGSTRDIERIVAASQLEVEAFKLAGDFVALLPRPNADPEVAKLGVDTNELMLRRLELWNLIWGATFAKEMLEQVVVPQLAERVKTTLANANNKDRFSLQLAESSIAETVELLKKAAPGSPQLADAEAQLPKLRQRIDELYKEEVEKTRMLADRYKGGDRKALEAIVKKALSKEYKGVLRIVINGEGWTEPETIAWWDEKNVVRWSRTKSLLSGQAAVETKEKGLQQYRIIPFSFSQSWDWVTRGFYPPRISHGGWGTPIMKKNINK